MNSNVDKSLPISGVTIQRIHHFVPLRRYFRTRYFRTRMVT